MCMRCDGYSWEEIDRHHDLVIRVHGFLLIQVEEDPPWSYTVGARESWDRPELLMIDIRGDAQAILIRSLADDYVRLGRIDEDTLDDLDVELVAVHESHFRDGMVGVWEDRYSRSATTGDFLQIVPGPSWFCDCHVAMVRRLDAPRE